MRHKSTFCPYQLHGQVNQYCGLKLPSKQVIGPGSLLVTRKGMRIRINNKLGSGGEATVYTTDRPDLVAKVYSPDSLTVGKFEKLKLMVSGGLDWSDPATMGICWPKGLLFDQEQKFRGYLMPAANGRPIENVLFIKNELERTFPEWTRRNLVKSLINILSKIKLLQDANILLGDINPQNILIQNENSVYFVDTDSYQVDSFPCPVGTVQFTPPELQGINFSGTMRTFENENFAVAVLCFQIIMLGKHPFSKQGGSSIAQNIKDMEFPYPVGKNSRRIAPDGPWRFIWSNLPYKLKKAFYEVFDKSSKSIRRKSASDWIWLMKGYYSSIDNRHVSSDLFPKSMKLISEHARRVHSISAITKYRSIICIDCGSEFKFSEGEEDFYRDKGLSVPKRCQDCRQAIKRKERRRTSGRYIKTQSAVRITKKQFKSNSYSLSMTQLHQHSKSSTVMQCQSHRRRGGILSGLFRCFIGK